MDRHHFLQQGAAAIIGIFFLSEHPEASAASLGSTDDASSVSSASTGSSSSSSVTISEGIKTLDMSLPNYSEVKDYKASVSNVQSLSVPPAQGGGGAMLTNSQRKRKDNGASEEVSSGPSPFSKVLPSLNKQGPKARNDADASGYVSLD